MTEKERMIKRLTEMSALRNFNVFPGDGPFTEEQLCGQINNALDQLENGTATVLDSFNDDCPKIDVRTLFRK